MDCRTHQIAAGQAGRRSGITANPYRAWHRTPRRFAAAWRDTVGWRRRGDAHLLLSSPPPARCAPGTSSRR